MNRQILFRGKRVDNDEFAYGDLLHLPNGDVVILSNKGYAKIKPEKACENCKYRVVINTPDMYEVDCFVENGRGITRPPSSWQYVEELK